MSSQFMEVESPRQAITQSKEWLTSSSKRPKSRRHIDFVKSGEPDKEGLTTDLFASRHCGYTVL